MRTKHYLSAAAVATVCLMFASCQGRRADSTPNGETVEVSVERAMPAADTDTAASAEAETEADSTAAAYGVL